jgi:hypothetical protein
VGSKLRKLRVKAGITGFAFNARQRQKARDKERKARAAQRAHASEASAVQEARKGPISELQAPKVTTPEPATGASVGPEVRLYESPPMVGKTDAPRPPAAGMRIARRMPLLAQVALMSMVLAGVEPPKGDR